MARPLISEMAMELSMGQHGNTDEWIRVMTQNATNLIELVSGRFVVTGEGPDRTVWPGLTERLGDITRAVFADSPVSALTTSDLLYLVQVVEAYEALINMVPTRRDRICTAIRKAARLREKTR